MKKVIAYESCEEIPTGAKYLRSEKVPDYGSSKLSWQKSPGLKGLFFETLYRTTPMKMIHYYEVEFSDPIVRGSPGGSGGNGYTDQFKTTGPTVKITR